MSRDNGGSGGRSVMERKEGGARGRIYKLKGVTRYPVERLKFARPTVRHLRALVIWPITTEFQRSNNYHSY